MVAPSCAGEGAQGEAPRVKWLPLEADPVLLAQYVNCLGGPISCAVEASDATEKRHEAPEAVLSFEDILSLEDWAVEMARNPTVAVLLVYPVPKDEPQPQQEQKETKHGAEGVWFTKQTVGNACGTVALVHCIANLPRTRFPLQPNGILETFFKETASLSPPERARALEQSSAFAAAHRSFETRGQSAVPAEDKADVDTHYVTFILDEKSKEIVELDGRKCAPVFHETPVCVKEAEGGQHLLKSVAAIIRDEFVAKSKGDLRFQLIAVGDAQAGRKQRQLQL